MHAPHGEYTKEEEGGAGVVFGSCRAVAPEGRAAHGTRRGPAGNSGSVTRGRAQPPSLLRGAARLGTGHKAKRRRAWALVL